MRRRLFAAVSAASLLIGLLTSTPVAAAGPLTDLVDPLVGSFAPGFTNPGPVLPHGMVGLGPDTTEGPLNYGGYYITNSLISGFSHTHMSAGVWQGGQVALMPVVGDVETSSQETPGTAPIPAYASPFDRATEVAQVGAYAVTLARHGVRAELTATERTGWHRYTYPPAGERRVVVDISRTLRGFVPGEVELSADGTLVGTVRSEVAGPVPVSFALRTDQPVSWTTFEGDSLVAGEPRGGNRLGVIGTFDSAASTLLVKVGISFTDVAGALANLDAEAPGWDFDATRAAAIATWEAALGRVQVEGGTPTDRSSLYTALYHAQLFPNLHSDVDGRYRGADQQVHHSDRPRYSQFSLWDSYRGQNALLAVLQPQRYADMLASLADWARLGGRLPRWQLGAGDPGYMSGDPVMPFIAEGWCRGLVDAGLEDELYTAMHGLVQARPAAYAARGWLPVPAPGTPVEQVEGGPRQAGTTLEYGLADFALALVAHARGDADGAAALVASSQAYRHLLDPKTGFIRPRLEDGSWLEPFAPELGYGFQEGTSWQYSWLVPHDLAGLLEGMAAGADPVARLDTFFGAPVTGAVPVAVPKVQNQATLFGLAYYGNQYAPGNEHDLGAPYVYSWLGRPDRTAAVSRGVASIYTPTPDGLPGNDDLGALSGWLAWTLLGLFPAVPGAPLYVIGSPAFERVQIAELVVHARGSSAVNRFVQTATLDRRELDRAWVTESELAAAGLELTLGPAAGAWATGPAAAPPSASTHPLAAFGCLASAPGRSASPPQAPASAR